MLNVPIRLCRILLLGSAACLMTSVPASAQTDAVAASSATLAETADPQALRGKYERASFFNNALTNHFMLNAAVAPTWIGTEDSFWYCRETETGCTYTEVNAQTGAKSALFDHERLSRDLEALTKKKFPAADLRLGNVVVTADRTVTFAAFGKTYSYTRAGELKELGAAEQLVPVASPDGTMLAFVRDSNIWTRNVKTGKERQLTEDGEKLFAYAILPDAFRQFSTSTELKWSPDSKKILTVQTDDRQVKVMPLVDFVPDKGVRPVAVEQRQAFPGDAHVPTYRIVVIDVGSKRQTDMRYPRLPAVRMLDTPIGGERAWWSGDAKRVFFVDIERGEKTVHLISADAETGIARELFQESDSKGYVELSEEVYSPTLLRILPRRNQILWYSERSGAGQLYLYDLATGRLIRQLTKGTARIRGVLAVDEARGTAWVATSGGEAGKNPYYRRVARVDLDSGAMRIVSSGDDDRVIADGTLLTGAPGTRGFSPSGNYWVETQTRVDKPGRSVLKRAEGTEVAVVEQAELRGTPAGFRLPEPVMLTAADGVTPIQAIVVRPSDFDPNKRYPVIDHIYGGPQVANVPSAFAMSAVWAQSLAELGFVVVVIDGRGTTGRGRAFHTASYGAVETASNVEDHIAGIRQLAARYPYMDISRVGINGFSGGGYMTASAMFRFPDFYKVGVAESGNHDQRGFWHSWGERYQGLNTGKNYDAQANVTYASQLKGKLLLMHGLLDFGVQPGVLFQLTQKLMDENKNFDLVVLPKLGHQPSGYSIRRRWDYFVQNLAGLQPPQNFKVVSDSEIMKDEMIERGGKPEDEDSDEMRPEPAATAK
ncbi:hypothetical protein CDQ91_05170 [Sphingopyxis witflariensis]|uniref:S9 family peptidase n=2 Tax=Sphingopyxis witflariensis TaxID=173675 RepID=A0A246K3H6_9SPHN|nr:hypothetical protein CDQ91_05170 [Sphingopyxis witflariensis]